MILIRVLSRESRWGDRNKEEGGIIITKSESNDDIREVLIPKKRNETEGRK